MKNLYIFLLLVLGISCFGQSTPGVDIKLSPDGVLENVFDQNGNKYSLSDIKAGQDVTINNTLSRSAVLCSSGIFDLYFETGSGMESTTDATEIQRRAVVCQVFNDLSNFIISPLQNAGNTTKVRIWVRNIANIPGVPSNALGLATGFYNLPQNNTVGFGGIADNEVWKTITAGKDSYINVTTPLVSSNSTPNPSGNFYHGMMAFNFSGITWNTNLNINAPIGQYDLYSVVLHEVTHALGFVSLMDENGQSVFGGGFNYFSRYDTFLKNNAETQSLITNGAACSTMYNYNFNSSLATSILHPSSSCLTDQTTCSSALKFVGTSTVPIYTTNCFEPGSSLSHFEDLCVTPNVNNAYFVMSNAISNGAQPNSVNTKRFLKFQERNTLGDLGYKLNTTYGNDTTVFGSYNNYGGVITNGVNVAGINDGLTSGNYSFIGYTDEGINITGILTNDVNATGFECLEDISINSNSILSVNSGTSLTNITFTTSAYGLHLLRYVPYNITTGIRGNISYIYVYVYYRSSQCNNLLGSSSLNGCDLVLNGNFEISRVPSDGNANIGVACGWLQDNFGGTDYYNSNTSGFTSGVPCNSFGNENDLINSNHAYGGFQVIQNFNSGGIINYYERLINVLKEKLLPNTNYQLSFDVSLSEIGSGGNIKIQAYFEKNYNFPIPYNNITVTNPNLFFVNSEFSSQTNGWRKVIFNFTTDSTAGDEQYLLIGAIENVEIIQTVPMPIIGGCFQSSQTTSSGRIRAYYYVDNVSLIPLSGASLNLPPTICNNQILSNLTTYLSATPTSGVFTSSGNGIINTAGIYSFDPTVAGVGSHIITYTYTNSSGCSVPISDTIIVTNTTGITPTFNTIAPICSGTTLSPLPTTSTNGITGTWSPALDNLTTTTYTFRPNSSECATTATLTITVLPTNDPSCVNDTCLPNLTLNSPETNSSIIYKRLNWIETNTNYTTLNNQDIKMKAGDFINLASGTHIRSGTLYLGKIEDCTTASKTVFQRESINENEKNEYKITIYPNPTKDNVTIKSANSKIKSIIISSIDGKICFLNNNINNSTYILDASSYQNGIYIISIETSEGRIIRDKLIRK